MSIPSMVRLGTRLAVVGALLVSGSSRTAAAAEKATPAGHAALAGARSSHYGIRPFPAPEEWVKTFRHLSGRLPGSRPVGIWIVGGLFQHRGCRLEFPGEEGGHPEIAFLDHDRHEHYLDAFDQAGIDVYLQVEPGLADVETLTDLVLSRYGHHPSVVGFGVDVEWYRESEFPGWGMRVDDATAQRWEARVESHRAGYRLFLKHWDERWMPPAYRGDIVFIDDSQELDGLSAMADEFAIWGRTFAPNPVLFQIGYRSDRPWWQRLRDPVTDMGQAICTRVSQTCGIVWVDFTLRDVTPGDVLAPPTGRAGESAP
jgi:hypothetical protein